MRIGVPSIWAEYELMVLVALVVTGISTQERSPASSPNTSGPTFKLSIEVVPVEQSYSIAPPSTLKPPIIEVVASPPLVLMEKIGTAVVDVAMVQAYAVEFKMVEVEEIG